MFDLIPGLFAEDQFDIGCIKDVYFRINTDPEGKIPVTRPYIQPPWKCKEIKRQVQILEKNGLVKRSSSSYASPVILVAKPGTNKFRMCADLRGLNKITIKDKWPIPNIHTIFPKLANKVYFTMVNLRIAYQHVLIHRDDRHKTAFITQDGLYESERILYGLCNATQFFQRLIDRIMTGLLWVVFFLKRHKQGCRNKNAVL